MLELLKVDMNFTAVKTTRKDSAWGYPPSGLNKNVSRCYVVKTFLHMFLYSFSDPSANWTGMISDLMYGDADLVAASLTISPERASVIDFAFAIGTETYGLFVATHNLEEYAWLSFSYPFR
jgi:ABC-type amino acid transport substrate-binding protein